MRDNFINAGNKTYINAKYVKCIISAGADKVRRIVKRSNLDQNSALDLSFDKGMRSMFIFSDMTYGVSSVNASTLAQRANAGDSQSDNE